MMNIAKRCEILLLVVVELTTTTREVKRDEKVMDGWLVGERRTIVFGRERITEIRTRPNCHHRRC